MKTIVNYITEGLKISAKTKVDKVGAEKIAEILDLFQTLFQFYLYIPHLKRSKEI